MKRDKIIETIKQFTMEERLELIELASVLIREEIQEKAKVKTEKIKQLKDSAKFAQSLYESDGLLHDLLSSESEDYFENKEDYLTNKNLVSNV